MPWIEQQLIANGVSAEGRVVVAKAILEMAINDQVLSIAVDSGGTGYVVGETFDIVGGTAVAVNGASFVARGRVTSVSSGVVTGVEILSSGAYSADPTLSGAATTNASLSGNDDLTVDVTMQTALWTQDRSTYSDLLTNFEWLATSVKSSNAPVVGLSSILDSSNDAVRLVVATSYDSGSTWVNQPGAPTVNNFYVNCPNQSPQLFVSITERRINFLISDGTFKQYGGIGLFIPITDTDGNYPFPGVCHGQSRTVQAFNTSMSSTNRGIIHPENQDTAVIGQYQYRDNLSSAWLGISDDNNGGLDTARSQIWPEQSNNARWNFNFAPVPAGSLASSANMNPFNSTQESGPFDEGVWFETASQSDETGSQGPQPLGPGSQLHYDNLAVIMSNRESEVMNIGYIDGFRAIHGRGLNAFDEVSNENGDRFLVFNETNTSDLHRWVAMEKL